ncbi:MAG: TonB-dependent receptor plug domain-containing protein [Dysgonamonadaceae bacterium]|jgi:TonB-dependent SusC/RagA subfamily outer membrane receptor|nr:TonB-dependent receptor plug domain-containing protein [Dysgonamonadaceae bacterium]
MLRLSKIFRPVLLLTFLSLNIHAQNSISPDSLVGLFNKQLDIFPMEKIYVQTDKPFYIGGENVWFRIFLTNALTNTPDSTSRYVYGELISPLDELITRVKIRPQDGAYFGYFALPETLPEGNYMLRFYTKFMEGRGEEYFFKRQIRVGDPLSAYYYTKATFAADENKKRINAQFQFINAYQNEVFLPEKVRYRDKNGEMKQLKMDKDSLLRLSLNISDLKKQIVYLEYDYDGKFHNEYIPITLPNEDFDVSFFPEGGHLPSDTYVKVGFKALNSRGLSENISGSIIGADGDTLSTFSSKHAGMGSFSFFASAGKQYKAVCKNEKGIEKNFSLPVAQDSAVSLSVVNHREKLMISVVKSEKFLLQSPLYIIAHSRGLLISILEWNNSKSFVSIPIKDFPSGIAQILLVDAQMNPISERLTFIINEDDFAKTAFAKDKERYGNREKVSVDLRLNGASDTPLEGNFSVSVTDDSDVKPDSTVDIYSSMLLTSELRGYIEDPAFYFRNRDVLTDFCLDELMLTQGWRRYNIAGLLKGKLEPPRGVLELGEAISGLVRGGILLYSPAKENPVTAVSFENGFFNQTFTDAQGRFFMAVPELPDSSRFVVQATTKKGGSRVELLLDSITYPQPNFNFPLKRSERELNFSNFIGKADRKYVYENGMRTIYLDEVVVTAKRTEKKGKSSYSSAFSTIVSNDEIEKLHARSILDVLRTIGGVMVIGEKVSIRGGGDPLVMIDDFEYPADELSGIIIEDVDQVEVMKGAEAAIFGMRGGNGVILISTKRGFDQALRKSEKFNIKPLMPLGYQKPKEFYAPKYETAAEINDSKPDLRTTIYWNPNVKFTGGKAQLSFYSADTPSTYSVIVEGISSDGKLIRIKETVSTLK